VKPLQPPAQSLSWVTFDHDQWSVPWCIGTLILSGLLLPLSLWERIRVRGFFQALETPCRLPMYITIVKMYMEVGHMQTPTSTRKNKHLILDQTKLKKAQKILGAKTETETIERALDQVISEDEQNRRAWAATEKLLQSGIQIKDVFGRLDGK